MPHYLDLERDGSSQEGRHTNDCRPSSPPAALWSPPYTHAHDGYSQAASPAFFQSEAALAVLSPAYQRRSADERAQPPPCEHPAPSSEEEPRKESCWVDSGECGDGCTWGSLVWMLVVAFLVGVQLCVSVLLIDDLLAAYSYAQMFPATSVTVLHEMALPYPYAVLCNSRALNVELEPILCLRSSASGAQRHCLASDADLAADASAASASVEPFWARNVSCIGLPSALGPVDAYGLLSLTVRVHSAAERAIADGSFASLGTLTQAAEQNAAEQPGLDLWLLPRDGYERFKREGECASPAGLQSVQPSYSTHVLATKQIRSLPSLTERLWRPGQLRGDVQRARHWLCERENLNCVRPKADGDGAPDEEDGGTAGGGGGGGAGARDGADEGAPDESDSAGGSGGDPSPPWPPGSAPASGESGVPPPAEPSAAPEGPAAGDAPAEGGDAAAAPADDDDAAAGRTPAAAAEGDSAATEDGVGAEEAAAGSDADGAGEAAAAIGESSAAGARRARRRRLALDAQPRASPPFPPAGREVYSVTSSVSPMYGPFASQQLDLLEVELRWLSTDVAVHAQIPVFSKAQLVGAICGVLACAHIVRALLQAALRRAAGVLRSACSCDACDAAPTPPCSPPAGARARRGVGARERQLL